MRTRRLPPLHALRTTCMSSGVRQARWERRMSQLDLARRQFAMTSIYHFLFVPVTIGLAFLAALLQTAWDRSNRPEYLRLFLFFGTMLLINVAVGVVTGLVQ